jgi:CBS domain containing-hemolysin-like protein
MAIPRDYLESSKGNFSFFTIDSHIIRVAGTTIVIAAITAVCIVVGRLIYYTVVYTKLRDNKRIIQIIFLHKKITYRLLEFFYKTCNFNSRILTDH